MRENNVQQRDEPTIQPTQATGARKWLRSIGPGLVTACVVIGPGSILTSSKLGASEGYANSWVLILTAWYTAAFNVWPAVREVLAG